MKRYRIITFLLLLTLVLSFAGVPNAAASDTASIVAGQISPQCGSGCPSMTVSKTADATSVMAGDMVGFKIMVTNTGVVALTGVTITDALATGLTWTANNANCSIDSSNALYCALGGVAVGQSVTVHVTAMTPKTLCTTLTNTANAWADGVASTPTNTATVMVSCTTLAPDISVTKTAEAATVTPGTPVRFTLTVANSGTGSAQGVILRDALPNLPGLSWSIDSVSGAAASDCGIAGGVLVCDLGAVEAAGTRVITVSSPTTGDSCGLVSNTATVSATNEGADKTANNTATASTTVNCPPPVVKLVKLPDASPVNLNQALGFSLSAQNTGTSTVKNFRVMDQLAAGIVWAQDNPACSISASNALTCAFGDLAAGATVSVHITAPAGTTTCGDLTNTAFAVGDNLPQQASNTSTIAVNCAADITVTKVPSASVIQFTPSTGGQYTSSGPAVFTITTSNHGTGAATNVILTDNLPVLLYAGQPANTGLSWTITSMPTGGTCAINNNVLSCTFASIGAGQSQTLVISAPTNQVPPPATQTTEIVNTVSVTADNEPLTNRTDNQSTAKIQLTWSSLVCVSDPPFNGSYFDNFSTSDANAVKGWSNYMIDHTRNGTNTPFLGRFTNDGSTLTIGCLPVNTYITLSFDIYILGSMDGNAIYPITGKHGPGPDVFTFLVSDPRAVNPVTEGQVLLKTTFTNWSFFKQAYPGSFPGSNFPGMTGATAVNTLGYDYLGILKDSTYHLRLTFYNTRETQMFVFNGTGLQVLWDESWGINNVAINTSNEVFLPIIGQP